MKLILNAALTILIISFYNSTGISQVKIGNNPSTIDGSSLLELESTNKGLLVPRMTSAQKSAIVTPVTGLLIFQTDNSVGFQFYDGTSWKALDDLGSHGATQNIELNGNYLSGDGNNEGIFVDGTGNVGVNTGTPAEAFHVNGSVRIQDGSQGANKILTSDANGTASWQDNEPIYLQISDSTIQLPTVTSPMAVKFSTNDEVNGISHTANDSTITISTTGVYNMVAQPQVNRNSNNGVVQFHCWFQIDTGSGWQDVPNSNVLLDMNNTNVDDVIIVSVTSLLTAGDKIRVMISTTDVSKGVKLLPQLNITNEPNIPSIIFTMFKI